MKFSLIAAVSSILAVVSAQDIPSCAFGCLGQFQKDTASTGCGAFVAANFPCICAKKSAYNPSIACLKGACSASDAQKAQDALLSNCK